MDGQQRSHRPYTRPTTLNLRKKKEKRIIKYIKKSKNDNLHINIYRIIREIIE